MRTRPSVGVLGTLTVVAIVVAGAMPALAASTSFSDVSAVAGDQHDVTVAFTESGLASLQNVTDRLQARAKDSYACYDSTGARRGSAALVERPTSQNDYQANAAGTIDSATIATSVLPQAVCPNGETSYLFKTVFGKLLLTDLTTGIAISLPGKFVSCSPADCVPPAHL